MRTADLTGREIAEVGFFDLANEDQFHVIGTTSTWNWQMGSQVQWLGGKNYRQIIYNTRRETPDTTRPYPEYRATIHDLDTGEDRHLPLPVYIVAPNGKAAFCVNYSRFQVTHPTICYRAWYGEPTLELAPEDDGIFRMDIETGRYELILSLADLKRFQNVPSMEKAIHWVTHMEMNPSSTRLLFIHRWTERVEDETCFLHRLFTCDPDGSNLRLLECSDHPLPQLEDNFDPNSVGTFDYEKSEYQISHPLWKGDDHVIVWGPHDGEIHYHLYNDVTGEAEVIGRGELNENGHMTYYNGGNWMLSDTYPDDVTDERFLFLWDSAKEQRIDIGVFKTDPNLGKENRCDLHPRWSADGKSVCIDSIHETERQLYIVDVSGIME
ncbi:hypothetical protein [Pseudovibrio flavus]|uniref:hypothetical protein n=1 Tax=Pseudovibrio flavus TaxID=2529854 RepID=UPI00211BD894|nr:hypothetical protein [Pseudovibrio flavus]